MRESIARPVGGRAVRVGGRPVRRFRIRCDEAPGGEGAVAETVRTLAVLLQAGASPLAAWRHLAESGSAEAVAVLAEVERGRALVAGIRSCGGVWPTVASAWSIAATVGAPLGDVLRAIAAALEGAGEIRDEVDVALAEPAGTARLMLWLPVVGLLLGTALGFDTVTVLATQPAGWACLAAGIALLLAARAWTRALVRRARPPAGIPGIRAELLVVALAGGTAIPRALALVAEETGEPGRDPAPIRDRPDDGEGPAIERVLRLSAAAGVPAVELLRAEAARARRDARTRGRKGAARLSSSLLLPLGACTLPAFLLLGVAPLILSVLTTTPIPLT
ncbi:type II secretion system F family protein [Microbacterium capsulatum]|uniref:Type II secretion system F family protein n=1 Tax=Microbacterium capsulatum TaxID=3041921 RepID=A0ABU0XGY9_9MICO|nr:type II secretion system F family protein [Microbacterium sp. ASV81]MDQ4214389.1 type II secretion system F family protein [Microbacterium sp. ASV81]